MGIICAPVARRRPSPRWSGCSPRWGSPRPRSGPPSPGWSGRDGWPRSGWPAGPGYALTPRATSRLDEAAERIYHHGDQQWEGHWHVLVVDRVPERARRERVRAALHYLGYAPLGETTWISPRASVELAGLLEAERLRAERFQATFEGDPHALLRRAWDLDGLAQAYRRWLAMAAGLVAAVGPDATDEMVFARRSILVHEWRKFLFTDPGLPASLLPAPWPGDEAARLFHAESARLLPARPVSWTVACRRICRHHPGPRPEGIIVADTGHSETSGDSDTLAALGRAATDPAVRAGAAPLRGPLTGPSGRGPGRSSRRPGHCPVPRTGTRSARPRPEGR